MMFRGGSSGASVMPLNSAGPLSNMNNPSPMAASSPSISNNPPGSHLQNQQNPLGSPMPPPYSSFGSPALNAGGPFIRPENRTASNSNLISSTTFLPTTSSDSGGYGASTSSTLFGALQLKDVSNILQDGRSFVISLLLQVRS